MAITPTNYTFCQQITGQAPAATNSGQVLLVTGDSLDATFWSHVANGGGDIRVCENADGTGQLPIDVALCNTVTSTLILWTRKPSYASASRSLYVFSKNGTDSQPAASSTFGSQAVWQDFTLVVHQGKVEDATGTHTVSLNGTPTTATGMWGGDAYVMDGAGEFISVNHATTLNIAKNYTLSIWNNGADLADSETFLYKSAANIDGFRWFKENSGTSRVRHPNLTEANLNYTLENGVGWDATDYDGTTRRALRNGASVLTDIPVGTVANNTDDIIIGNNGYDRPLEGWLGEVWLSIPHRNPDYTLEYSNQNTPGTFWTQSAPDDPSAGAPESHTFTGGSALTIAKTAGLLKGAQVAGISNLIIDQTVSAAKDTAFTQTAPLLASSTATSTKDTTFTQTAPLLIDVTPSLTKHVVFGGESPMIVITSASIMSSNSAPNLLTNGSFESPVITANSGNYQHYVGNEIDGWTIIGDVDLVNESIWAAADGVQSMDLNGTDAGSITQTVTGLTPNGTYNLSFAYAIHAYAGSVTRSMNVLANGQVVGSVTTDSLAPNYLFADYDVVADANGEIVVRFDALDTGTDMGMVLDKVALVETPALYLSDDTKSLTVSNTTLPFLATATQQDGAKFRFAIAHNDSAQPTHYPESEKWLYSSDNQLLFSSDSQILEGA